MQTIRIKPLQFQRATDPGMTPPELEALGLSLAQSCAGMQIYELHCSEDQGNGFYLVHQVLSVTVDGDYMHVSAWWLCAGSRPHKYSVDTLRDYVFSAHRQYPDYKFPPIREPRPDPTEDEIFQEALNEPAEAAPEPWQDEELATPWEQRGLAFQR